MKPPSPSLIVAGSVIFFWSALAVPSRAAGTKGYSAAPRSDQQKQENLDKYDKNGDGKIDDQERAAMIRDRQREREEAKAAREAELMKKYDLNHDGKLDASERAAMKADQEKNGAAPKKPGEEKKEKP